MRFAYINSQGKEVGIPSVEALQLRIELGAIVESTMFFDANADRWAPAGDHDIFRTLQREIASKEGGDFVAPPPPTLEAPSAPESLPLDTPPEDAPPAEAPTSDPTEQGPPAAEAEEAGEDADIGLDDLTLVSTEEPAEARAESGMDHDLATEFSDLGFELTTLKEGQEEQPPASEIPPPSGPFDFGDFGALEVEGSGEEEEESEASPAMESIELETPLGEQEFGGGAGVRDSLELETPMSEYSPERPPSWMDEREQEPGGGVPARPPREASERSERPAAPRQQETAAAGGGSPPPDRRGERGAGPRARPARPAREEKRGPAGAIAAVVLLLLVGGGGWFGWNMFHSGSAGVEEQSGRTYAAVEIPALAAELEPTFRAVADAALQDWVQGQRDLPALASLPEQPPPDWLAGVYLANASQYQNVADYWTGLNAWVEGMRSQEERLFREAFEARLDSAGVAASEREALTARAVAGFRSALPERDAAYDALAALAGAALDLHEFLLEREPDIEYEPAAGGLSRDPVLEAVPITPALGEEMWDRVDRITAALEDMDALTDRVTTERLVTLTLDQLAGTTVH